VDDKLEKDPGKNPRQTSSHDLELVGKFLDGLNKPKISRRTFLGVVGLGGASLDE
jgi:hypothetical protein